MTDRTRTVSTADRRELAVCEWGAPNGSPVFSLHGTPGSRLGRHFDEQVYVDAGARVITYDRPGYGRSTRHPGRDVVAAAADVVTVADALGIGRFSVVGGSGGGPHALAVAAVVPDRVERCASVVGIAPRDADGLDWFDGMTQGNIDEFGWALEGEAVLRERMGPICEDIVESVAAGRGLGKAYDLSDGDRAILADPRYRAVASASVREAFAHGTWGLVDDDIAFTRPWGFDPASIVVPTQVWYGTDDTLVPAPHGRWLLDRIPGARERIIDGGHLAIVERAAELYGWLAGRD